jgi:hypothetical protein
MMDEDQPQNQPSIRGRSSGCTDRVVDIDLTVAPAENEEFDDMETGMSGYIFVEKSSQTPMEKEACGSQGGTESSAARIKRQCSRRNSRLGYVEVAISNEYFHIEVCRSW